ncbi:unnamed protein product [Miscanthus lutarioriparius]|uniref:FRIGIDA-like protein n=1 Tax=Miscanthus lutarioriparius TaxID=422564 RepID=A0A811MWY6_9POAL|nr:unnamed protein product [Miscanthus lutarioriparius]
MGKKATGKNEKRKNTPFDALREAFDSLAACSPYPLPFTWEDLDAHVSSVQSSISRRFRQLRALEAARPGSTSKNKEGANEVEEEEVEEEEEEVVVEEEEEEVEEEEEEVEEEEEEEVVEEEEEVEVEEEEEEEEEEENDKQMKEADDNIGNQAKEDKEGGEDNKRKRDADEEAETGNYSDPSFGFVLINDLIDYMIGNGQHLKVFHLVQILNLEDKYPPFSLLKGYIEKAKQTTSVEIFRKNETHKSLNLAIPKELWIAHHLAEQKLADSRQRSAIIAEINYLMSEYKKEQRSANPSMPSTWDSQQPTKHKKRKRKRKKEEQEHHDEAQDNQQQQEQNENKLIQGKQHQLHQQENKAQVTEQQQQHMKLPRPATLKLPTPAVPLFLPALFPLAILVVFSFSGFATFLPAPAALVDFECADAASYVASAAGAVSLLVFAAAAGGGGFPPVAFVAAADTPLENCAADANLQWRLKQLQDLCIYAKHCIVQMYKHKFRLGIGRFRAADTSPA